MFGLDEKHIYKWARAHTSTPICIWHRPTPWYVCMWQFYCSQDFELFLCFFFGCGSQSGSLSLCFSHKQIHSFFETMLCQWRWHISTCGTFKIPYINDVFNHIYLRSHSGGKFNGNERASSVSHKRKQFFSRIRVRAYAFASIRIKTQLFCKREKKKSEICFLWYKSLTVEF